MAWLMLAVILQWAMPRSWFHHCAEGDRRGATDKPALVVNEHCPICEAPVLPCETAPLVQMPSLMHVTGEATATVLPIVDHAFHEVPRLRGPPMHGCSALNGRRRWDRMPPPFR